MRRQPQIGPGHPPRLTPKTGRPSKALKGLAVHHCQYPHCGKTYTRKEHLLRHERTHRNELPYVCSDCNAGYARQDLLKRHSNLKHGHPLDPSLIELGAQALVELDALESIGSLPHQQQQQQQQQQQPPSKPQPLLNPPYQNIQPQEPIVTLSSRQPVPELQTPTRQFSLTSHALQSFQQLDTSPAKVRLAPAPPRQEPLPKTRPPPRPPPPDGPRVLPVPWGARLFPGGLAQCNVDLLVAAAYGDLTEIRRLHLRGVNVLATGNFDTGDPKSALYAAAEAIKTGFEDIHKYHGRDQERLWQGIAARTEVVKYLIFHGANLNTLDSVLRAAVQRALQGQPHVGTIEQQAQTSVGFRPIAAASSEAKLRPMDRGVLTEKKEKASFALDTELLQRIKPDADEKKYVYKGKEQA